MKFTRTFHPVGQGAFFTEQLSSLNEEYDTTIVYDCGTISSSDQLNSEISDFKKEQKKEGRRLFDILFISHFDSDHVNGLKKLLKKDIATKAFIEGLVKKYNIDISDVEWLISEYLIKKYPGLDASLNAFSVDENEVLLKKYSIEKSTVEKLVYCFRDNRYKNITEVINKVIEYEKRKVVIVPFLYPHLIKILLPEMRNELSEDTYEALNALFDSDIKIIGLDNNDGYRGFYEVIPIDKNTLFNSDTRSIKGFTKIAVKDSDNGNVCWYYMPFNTIDDDGRKERFLVELFFALKSSTGKIGEWFRNNVGDLNAINNVNDIRKNNCFKILENFLMDGMSDMLIDEDTIDDFVKLLRTLYRKASSRIRGVFVSAINVNSLNVLSYSDADFTKNQIEKLLKSNYKMLGETSRQSLTGVNDVDRQYPDCLEQMRFHKYSCLYTGDCVMEYHFFDHVKFICDRVLQSSIGLIQIPHHGSKHNYNDQIKLAPISSSFVNFKQGTYTFADGIYSLAKEIPCFEVTMDEKSKFEHTIGWWERKK